ncbi:MAG: acyloxyacyl hydrolase [Gallionella sp.]
MKKLFMLMFLFLLAAHAHAYAVDGVFIEYGLGDASVISSLSMINMYRVGALWKWHKTWLSNGDWHVTGFWEASLGNWRGFKPEANNQTITDFGITPVFHLEQKEGAGVMPYLEAGIGVHLISPTSIYSGRNFSTALQFGDALGFGVSLGERRQFDLGYRFQHLSNGDIKRPNNGVDFNQIHLGYRF